jgi:hypothetical protein
MRLTLSKLPGHINRIVDKVVPQSVEIPAEPSVAEGSAAQPTASRQASSPRLQHAAMGPQSPQAAATSSATSGPYGSLSDKECQRLVKFERILSAEVVDLTALRDASWSGIPAAAPRLPAGEPRVARGVAAAQTARIQRVRPALL